MKIRQPLKNSILLCGEGDSGHFKRTFTILKAVDEGASSICYEAYYEQSGRGILKEFYPETAYGLERNTEGQLLHSPDFQDAKERFLQEEKEYLEPYYILQKIKQDPNDEELSTFIPTFEIYHGCDENGNIIGTTYVWTPQPQLETFDKICDGIHKYPNYQPEHKLFTVLSAIYTLTKCICALHNAELLHRDIKPSNFGFVKRGNEVLTQTLSMFDINSICSVYSSINNIGTQGFLEPEAEYETASNQTDIYAIGATLFNAIIVTDEVKENGYLYDSRYFRRIHNLVNNSKLIQATETNSYYKLRKILAEILEKCLSERSHRYECCEDLLKDIEKACFYMLPSGVAKNCLSGQRWVLKDIEKDLDANKRKNSFLAIQYHLYEHPIYECCSDTEDALNILIIGFGNYGQRFLDTCLQNGQIRGKKLHVTVISDNPDDKAIYLEERPALKDFFDVDGSIESVDTNSDTYGDIIFKRFTLACENLKANFDNMQTIMMEYGVGMRPHTVFIALGDDALNLSAARACKEAIEVLEMNCTVSFVCENSLASTEIDPALFPLFINQSVKYSPIYAEIERMAFNHHLVWVKNLNVDYVAARAEFRKPYNHDACVSGVLSIKSKLYSMGIDLKTVGFYEAARLFREKLSDKNTNKGLKNELIWIEHRRWVTEKLCNGYRCITNLEDCATGKTRDEKNKRHVCLVRSRPDQKLATKYCQNGDYSKWDTAGEDELAQLDELDRLSVLLYRMYDQRAKCVSEENLLFGGSMASIKALVQNHKKAFIAYQEWFSCLKDILRRESSKRVYLYDNLKNAFLGTLEELSEECKNAVEANARAFEALFYPVKACAEHRDWKREDVKIIDHIPFILTYTDNAYLVIPFATGDNDKVFGNVAAPTVVNPAAIIYLYLVEKKRDIKVLKETIPRILSYMDKKCIQSSIEFLMVYRPLPENSDAAEIEHDLVMLENGRITISSIVEEDGDPALPKLITRLKKRRIGKRFFAVEKNETPMSYLLDGAKFYHDFPSYQFLSDSMKFVTSDCDMLNYIIKKPYITVADMLSLQLSSSDSSHQPEFFEDYKDLWRKFTENTYASSAWKQFCKLLGECARQKDVIVSFKRKYSKNPRAQEYIYLFPAECQKSAEKILSFLIKNSTMESGSRVERFNSSTCKITVFDCYNNKEQYDKLFSDRYALMFPDNISIYQTTWDNSTVISFNHLVIDGIQIPDDKKAIFNSFLQYFTEKGYIIKSEDSMGKLTVSFASAEIKELLTTEGKILEIYTYHKAREIGSFDDVVSSYEIKWGDTDVQNEFDCILTKGFQTVFVECKARRDIEQDFYFKISSLAKQFGVNAKVVLIADTHENQSGTPLNTLQRERGTMMDVVTIWKQDEISDIGHTLLKILNGKYENEVK